MKQSEVKELSTAELQEELGKAQEKSYSDLKMAHADVSVRKSFTIT